MFNICAGKPMHRAFMTTETRTRFVSQSRQGNNRNETKYSVSHKMKVLTVKLFSTETRTIEESDGMSGSYRSSITIKSGF